jgi:hypothetical protein
MLLDLQGGERPVQALHRAPELPAREREHHHVVHEAHVEQPELLHRRIERAEVQRAEQRTERTAARDAALAVPVLPAPGHGAPHHLPQQVQHATVLDVGGEHLQQKVLVDPLVVRLHVGAQHEAVLRQTVAHRAHRSLRAAVALDVHAAPRHRQVPPQHDGQRLQHQGIPG